MVGYIFDGQTPEAPQAAADASLMQESPPLDTSFAASEKTASLTTQMQTSGLKKAETPFQIDQAQFGTNEAIERSRSTEELPKLGSDYINQTYGPPGPDGKPVKITDVPVPEEVGQLLGQRKKEQLEAEATWARFHDAHSWAVNTGVSMAAFMTDRQNFASMFIPALGEERALALVGRAGLATDTVLARTGARVIAGGTAGVASQAPLTAMKYNLSQDTLDDYSLHDAMTDMLYAGAGNAIIHAGVLGGAREIRARTIGGEAGIFKPDEMMREARAEIPKKTPGSSTITDINNAAPTSEASAPVPAASPEQPYNIFTPEGHPIMPSDKLSSVSPEANPEASLRTYNFQDAYNLLHADAPTKHSMMTQAVSQIMDGRPVDVEATAKAGAAGNIDLADMAEKQQQLARDGHAPAMTSGELQTATSDLFPTEEEKAERDAIQAEGSAPKPDAEADIIPAHITEQANSIKTELSKPAFDQNNIYETQKALGMRRPPQSLVTWLAKKGINKESAEGFSGELKGIFGKEKAAVLRRLLKKEGGHGLDELAMQAREMGYFHGQYAERVGENRGEEALGSDDLLHLIEQEVHGSRIYPEQIQKALDEKFGQHGMQNNVDHLANELQITGAEPVEHIAQKLHEYYKASADMATMHEADVGKAAPDSAEAAADTVNHEYVSNAANQLPEEYHEIIAGTEIEGREANNAESAKPSGEAGSSAEQTAGGAKSDKVGASGGKSEREGAGDTAAKPARSATGVGRKLDAIDDKIAKAQSKVDLTGMTHEERNIIAQSTKEVQTAEAYGKGYEAAANCLAEEGL